MIPIKRRLFPGYIPPLKDELFSSWFIRLCYEHKTKSYSFSKFYFNNQAIWNRDIDKHFPKSIQDVIIAHTVLSKKQLRDMLLVSFNGIVFNNDCQNSYVKGILNIGIYHRKRIRYGLLCCPSCLSSTIPYFKKQWRLSFSLGCNQCNCYLIDKCPNCKSPIAFHRLENGDKEEILNEPLYYCWSCRFDFRNAIEKYEPNSLIARYQKHIDKILITGYNDYTMYSFTFFSVLLNLKNKILTTSKKWNRIKIAVENHYKIRIITKKDKTPFYSLEQRKQTLLIVFKILSNWPKNFIEVFEGSNVRYCDFSKEFEMPFWFEKEVKNLN